MKAGIGLTNLFMKQALRIFIVCGVLVVLGIVLFPVSDEMLMSATELTNQYRNQLSLGVAFFGGMLFVISPCGIPMFLSLIMERVAEAHIERREGGIRKKSSLSLFLCGFFLVFLILGFSTSVLGQYLIVNKEVMVRTAGVLMVMFGTGILLRRGWMRFSVPGSIRNIILLQHPLSFFVLGVSTALGVGICSTPILFSVFAFTASAQSFFSAFFFMIAFLGGMCASLLLLFVRPRLWGALLEKIPFHGLELLLGGMLVVLGTLYFFGGGALLLKWDILGFSRFSYYIQAYLLALPLVPTFLTLLLVGGGVMVIVRTIIRGH